MNKRLADRLDYSQKTVEERLEQVNKILEEESETVELYQESYNPILTETSYTSDMTANEKDLETLANFLLYAKDSETEDTLTPYKNKRNKQREMSLLSIAGTPKEEDNVRETNKSIIKIPKVKVTKADREKYKELKTSGEILDNLTDMITTKKDSKGNSLSTRELNKLKWIRTDIQKDEIVVKLELEKYINAKNVIASDFNEEAFSMIRFDDIETIRILIENYSELVESSYDDTKGYIKLIMFVLEELIEETKLDSLHKDVLVYKVDKIKYDKMIELIEAKHNISLSPKKISLMTRKKIPQMIVDTYKRTREEWIYTHLTKGEYKTCTSCNENKLKSEKYFFKNAHQKDGYRGMCKECVRNAK